MKPEYFADIVPGVMRVRANRRRIPGFALCARSLIPISETETHPEPPLSINYMVNSDLHSGRKAAGKVYSSANPSEVSIQTPIGKLGSISSLLRHDLHSPTIEVNRAYHRTGRLTIGNVHSSGWLMRDLGNITLLKNGLCLIHAAALSHKDRTVLIVGLSNTGKSTTAFELTLNGPCRLFGDDLVVSDGSQLFSCPMTGTNIDPARLPTTRQRITHWGARNIPFYEYFGPSPSLSVGDYVGKDNIASPSKATDIVFLRRSSSSTDRSIGPDQGRELLLASNRTEFTYMNSAIFSAFDYLNDQHIVGDCVAQEEELLGKLAAQCRCQLIEGSMDDFRVAVARVLGAATNAAP